MKANRIIGPLIAVLAAATFFSGCASTGSGSGMTEQQVRDEVKGLTSRTYPQPLPKVHDAALRALTVIGCEIEDRQNYYVSGSRPHKIGLIVGSGGETVRVYMLPQSPAGTQVWVETSKSMLGIIGQRNWDEKTLNAIQSTLQTP